MADRLSTEVRSKIMSSIHSKNTKPELTLRHLLWERKHRYRIHLTKLPGKPDITFVKDKVAVFLDGDFWHGYNWKNLKPKLKNKFWVNKIKNNVKRDKKITKELRFLGWKVIRIWEHELKYHSHNVIRRIENELKYA